MVIKRSIQCPSCKEYVDTYVEENTPYVGMKIKCKCGKQHECTKVQYSMTKWIEIQ